MVRFVLRVALASSITVVAATMMAALVLVEAGAIGGAGTFREFVLRSSAAMWSGLILGIFALVFTFVPAAGAAGVVGGLLWHAGRDNPMARSLLVWAAAGAGCGGVVIVGLLMLVAERIGPGNLLIAGCGVLAGAAAAVSFRALMPLLPPWPEPGEDGGWER